MDVWLRFESHRGFRQQPSGFKKLRSPTLVWQSCVSSCCVFLPVAVPRSRPTLTCLQQEHLWRGVAPSINGAVAVSQAVAELRKSGLEMNFSFLNYAQSGQCRNWEQSSVSYAAGALYAH